MKIKKMIIFLPVLIQLTSAHVIQMIPESGISLIPEKSAEIGHSPLTNISAASDEEFQPAPKVFGSDYFPLTDRYSFSFDSNAGETSATFQRKDKGVAVTYDAPNFSYKQTLFKTEKGIFLTRTQTHAFLFFGKDISYPEPVLRIPFPLKAGERWHWEGPEVESEDTTRLTISGKAVGEETVVTKGGTFKCLRITLQISSENGSKNTVNEWFAPGLGLVKSRAKLEGSGITYILQKMMGLDEITFELESYKDIAKLEK